MSKSMKQWYKVRVYRGHVGKGKTESVIAYIFAEDVVGVLDKHKIMPGLKKDWRNFPDISPLSLEEGVKLEVDIAKEGRISIDRARKTWYYSGER